MKNKFNITRGEGTESWRIFVNGIWFDDWTAMAKEFYGENLWVEVFNNNDIIFCASYSDDEETISEECFYVKDGIKISDIVRALCRVNQVEVDEYDEVISQGGGWTSHVAELNEKEKYNGEMIVQFPEFINGLDSIKPIEMFHVEHPKFNLDLYLEIGKQVYEFENSVV